MDISYLLALQNFRELTGGFFDVIMTILSSVSTSVFAIVIPALFIWCIDKRVGYYIAFSVCSANFVTQFTKLIACVYRPWIKDSRILPLANVKPGATGYSFPSGHTTTAASLYGSLAVSYRKKKWLAITLGILILLIGFSRNYVGVHTPQDVFVGLLVGGSCLFLASVLLNYVSQHKNADLIISIIGTALIILSMFYIRYKSYPTDYVDGILLVDPLEMQIDFFASAGCVVGLLFSWLIERRFLKFTIEGKLLTKAIRYVIGIAGVLIIEKLLFPVILVYTGEFIGYFLRSVIIFVFILLLYPICFQWVEKKFHH